MTNMEKFDECAAQILNLLYEKFPVGIEIKIEDFPTYDNSENSKIFDETIAFLKREGFIRYAQQVYGGFIDAVLTAKGFAKFPAGPVVTRSAGPLTIFVSSTSLDLAIHRIAVKDAIARCDLFFRGMEHFGADPDGLPPAKLIVEEVRKADVYLGVFGVRYGSLDPVTGLSMTELEFREAETSKKQMLLYVMHQEASVPAGYIEADAEGYRKLAALKAHILKQYVPYLFRSPEDLGRQSQLDLAKLKVKS